MAWPHSRAITRGALLFSVWLAQATFIAGISGWVELRLDYPASGAWNTCDEAR